MKLQNREKVDHFSKKKKLKLKKCCKELKTKKKALEFITSTDEQSDKSIKI